MISDPTFSNIVPRETVGPAVKVTENWFVELKRAASGANPTIQHPDSGGLELRWEAPVGRARVWQPLDAAAVDSSGWPLDLDVRITLKGGTPRTIEWVAILEERDGDAQFHTHFKLSTVRIQRGAIVRGAASNVRLEAGRAYRFCIQFEDAPASLTLQSVVLEASKSGPPKAQLDDSAALVQQLKGTLDSDQEQLDHGAVERGVRTLFERNDRESLLRLMELVGGIAEPVTRSHPLRSQVIHYYARTMLNMNVSDTAYVHLKALLGEPLLVDIFTGTEIRQLRKVLARACLRTGRIDEAVEIHSELLREEPLDWEPYFHLGILQSAKGPSTRRLYHIAAETLAPRIPTAHLSAIAEAYINEGAPDEALKRALQRLKVVSDSGENEQSDDKELNLTLANAWLAVGESEIWLAYLKQYFNQFGLAGPEIDPNSLGSHILDVRGAPVETTRAGPLVTVIMTSFNAADTIGYAARAVLNQSHANLRLVIVDDCSNDGSRELVARLANEDDRVELLFNESNIGTYCSKNRALRQYKSDFYAFHDSDDWMHPERLAEHLAATSGDVRLTTSMWIRVDEQGRAAVRATGGYLHDNPASTFFGTDVVEAIGYFDSVRIGADSEFTWRARHVFGDSAVQQIRKPLALGLNREGSLTRSGPAAFDEFRHSPVRLKYWEAWAAWHRSVALGSATEMFLPYPLDERRFDAPAEILPERTGSS